MAENNPDSIVDIQRYLQQKMSPDEMHAYEKALLSDPFTSDALDGFAKADVTLSARHMDLIRAEIKAKNAEQKLGKAVSLKYGWLQIAAIVFIMVTGSVLLYSVLHQKSDAGKTSSPIAANKIIIPPLKSDSIKDSEKPMANVVIKPENNLFPKKPTAAPLILKDNNAPLASLNKNDLERLKIDEANTSSSPEMAAAPQNSNANKDNTLMADVIQKPAPSGVFNKALSDSTGDIVAAGRMNNMIKDKAAPGYVNETAGSGNAAVYQKTEGIEPAKNNLQRQTITAARDVASAKNDHKEKRAMVVSTTISSKKLTNGLNSINTENGLEKYIKKQVDSILIADGKKSEKISVLIEFSINEKGQPVNIKALNKTDKYYAEKAYYIIKNAPLWKPGTNKDVQRITVLF